MKKRRTRTKQPQVLHLWDWRDLVKAVPYLRSITGSLREHYLDMLTTQRKLDRAAAHPAPSGRDRLLESARLTEERQRAQAKFDEALGELNRLDVFLLDPMAGGALVPFRKADDLAWFVFDHFAPRGVIGWRYHDDPIERVRRLNLLPDVNEADLPRDERRRIAGEAI